MYLRQRQGILMSSRPGRGHAIPMLRKAVLANPGISTPPIEKQVGIVGKLDCGRN